MSVRVQCQAFLTVRSYSRRNVDPVALKVRVESTKALPKSRGLVIKCADENSRSVLISSLKTSLGVEYNVESAKNGVRSY